MAPDGIEWLLLVGVRRAAEVYDEAVRLAQRDELLPGEDDYLRLHLDLVVEVNRAIPLLIAELIATARRNPNQQVGATIGWNVPARILVCFDESIEEMYVALPRTAADVGNHIVAVIEQQLESESGLMSEEILMPTHTPAWVPPGWRCLHFMRS